MWPPASTPSRPQKLPLTEEIMAPNSDPSSQPHVSAATPARRRRLPGLVWWLLIWAICLLLTRWEAMAVYYADLPRWLCPILAAVTAITALAILLFLKP